MKKNQSAARHRSTFGEALTESQWRTMSLRGAGTSRSSLPVMVVAAKHQIHKVPFLRVGGATCCAR